MTIPIPASVIADAAAAARAFERAPESAEPAVFALAARAAFDAAELFCGRALVARAPTDALPQRWADLPGAIAQGIVLTVAALVERGADTPAPVAATTLWRPFRITRLLAPRQARGAADAAS